MIVVGVHLTCPFDGSAEQAILELRDPAGRKHMVPIPADVAITLCAMARAPAQDETPPIVSPDRGDWWTGGDEAPAGGSLPIPIGDEDGDDDDTPVGFEPALNLRNEEL